MYSKPTASSCLISSDLLATFTWNSSFSDLNNSFSKCMYINVAWMFLCLSMLSFTCRISLVLWYARALTCRLKGWMWKKPEEEPRRLIYTSAFCTSLLSIHSMHLSCWIEKKGGSAGYLRFLKSVKLSVRISLFPVFSSLLYFFFFPIILPLFFFVVVFLFFPFFLPDLFFLWTGHDFTPEILYEHYTGNICISVRKRWTKKLFPRIMGLNFSSFSPYIPKYQRLQI